MNEIIKAMEERRSIRKFKPEMPKKEDLQQIVEAGLYAANGMGRQATITVAVTNKELRDRLSAVNCKIGGWDESVDPFYGAPAILIVLAEKDWRNRVYDGSLVMGNMKKLGVEGEWEGIGHCAVGYIDGEMPEAAERKPNRVFWVE